MEEFIGEKIKVDFVQEAGWKRPTALHFRKKSYAVKEVISRWEEHDFGDPWWTRKHRVWYEVTLEDGSRYHLYWDRGPRGTGEDWILLKKVALTHFP